MDRERWILALFLSTAVVALPVIYFDLTAWLDRTPFLTLIFIAFLRFLLPEKDNGPLED